MFHPLNNELTFDIDLSTVGCGLNAAVVMSAMPLDGGQMKYNYTGAQYGTGFCDGQDNPPNCLEMDLWEANSLATSYTVHPCNETTGKCNAFGCFINNHRLVLKTFTDVVPIILWTLRNHSQSSRVSLQPMEQLTET